MKKYQRQAIKLAGDCLKEIGITRPFHIMPYSYRCERCGKQVNCTKLPDEKICTTCCINE